MKEKRKEELNIVFDAADILRNISDEDWQEFRKNLRKLIEDNDKENGDKFV